MMVIVHGSPLYQWDINRQLLIDSADLGSDFVIHCCYTEDANALVVEPKTVGDKVLVNIPNILLQRFGSLRVYVVTEGDTVYDATFYVMARPKPDDYVYTETEVLSYVTLSKRMDEFEKNGVSEEKLAEAINDYLSEHPITETDPTVPAWAKQSEKPKYTASEIGALSQDELQNGVNLALKQAKESGEFKGDAFTYEDFTEEQLESLKGADGYTPTKGKDYFDGNDYVLTESDKQEIADMIEIPESGGTKDYTEFINKPKINGVELNGDLTPAELGLNGGSEEWEVIADITLEEDVATLEYTKLKHKNLFVVIEGTIIDIRDPAAGYNNKFAMINTYINGTQTQYLLAQMMYLAKEDKVNYLIDTLANTCKVQYYRVKSVSEINTILSNTVLPDCTNGIQSFKLSPNMSATFEDKYQNCGRFKAGTRIIIYGVRA